jgi:site-specific DNA-methyltransferase (adenine-specific)
MPEEIAEICILAGCPLGGVVLDPFLGSGTTARVADRLARDCVGIELQPKYVEMADRRTCEPGFPLEIAAE